MRGAERLRMPSAALAALVLLAACATRKPVPDDDAPTLAVLRTRSLTIEADAGITRDDARAAAAYRALLARAPQGAAERLPALRRLGDLELELAEQRSGDGERADAAQAIAHYEAWLASQPDAEGRDAVLYQLARAHELGGDAGAALATLDRLVQAHPRSDWRDEAEFRRGELLFAARRWADAEAAYEVVLQAGAGSPWRDRALYMLGWSRYRQGRWDDALQAHFGVLDLTLGARSPGTEPARAEVELVDDTLRVVALSLEQLQGAAAIAPHVQGERRRGYAFVVYEQLAALYERQGRVRDAADTLQRFADAHPQGAAALLARLRVVELHERAGFASTALQARRDFVRAAVASTHDDERVRSALAQQLDLLAQHHHAEWQRTRTPAEAEAADGWYRLAEQHLHDARRGERRFLRAELLTEAGRHADAAQAYALAAYGDADHARRADAGHGELLALAHLPDATARSREAAQRFVQRFGDDARALAVRAQLAFDAGDWAMAEQAWARQLATTADAAERQRIGTRIAAALYRQGEAAREAGRLSDAAALFTRAGEDWPASEVAPAALFDAARAQLALRHWPAAARALEALRQQHPRHELAARAAPQLALAYAEDGQVLRAAQELERWAAGLADAGAARQARWQAAGLYARAGDTARAVPLWQRAVADPDSPLPQAVEARWQLAQRAREAKRPRDEQALLQALRRLDQDGGSARTEATRTWSALAALRLAEPLAAAYRQQVLAAPLQATLARKKARFDAVQAAYADAAATGSAEGSAAAALASAALYQDFGRALLAVPTPRGLKKADAEGLRVLLEEQALPFEDKAVEIYTGVAQRTRDGAWDEPVRQAYAALAALRPLRWGKRESAASAAAQAVQRAREAGRFDEAERMAEQALARDPADAATRLNLAILLDLYRHDAARALPHYRALAVAGQGPPETARWIAELEQRMPRQALAPTPREAAR